MADELEYPKGEAYALKKYGVWYITHEPNTKRRLDYWINSLQIFESIQDDVGTSNLLSNIGAIYIDQGADAKALEYMLRSLQLAEKTGDTLRMITALSNIGGIYYNKGFRCWDIYKGHATCGDSGNTEAYVVIAEMLAKYLPTDMTMQALEYFQKSIKAAGNQFSAAFSINGIGKVYQKQGKLTDALALHNQALDIARKFDDNLQIVRSMREVANVYFKQK